MTQPGAPPLNRLRLVVLSLISISVMLTLWTLVVMLSVRGQLTDARAQLQGARDGGDVDEVALALREAEDDLAGAVGRLGQPAPAIFARLPLVGRPVQAADRSAEAALAVVRSTSQVLAAADPPAPLIEAGDVDLEALARLADELDEAARATREPVAALREQPMGLLPGVVGDPMREAQDELDDIPEAFGRAAAGVRALGGVLGADGPRRLLLLLQNNAELRGTGGLVTVFAEAIAEDGRLTISAFRDVEDVATGPEDAVAVPAPPDYTDLWAPFLANTTLWKNANMEPDVPTSSAVLADIAARTLPAPPDALLWFDVPAIAAVLDATGPATLPDGTELTAGNAVDVLLSQAYRDAPDTREGQAQRRAVLRGAADAVLGRLLGQEGERPGLSRLGPALGDAAGGRHVAVWSAVPEEQADLLTAGLAGEVSADGGDLASFAVQNLGGGDREGNKLDYYARRSVAVRAVVRERSAEVEQEVVLRNTSPATGLPTYVLGGGTPGTTHNLVSLALPRGAELLEFSRGGQAVLTSPRASGDHDVLVDAVDLPPGTDVTWRLRYRVPLDDGGYALQLVPQPLAVDAELEVEVVAADDLQLEVPAGTPFEDVDDRRLALAGPFDRELDLRVEARRPGVLRRALDGFRSFWNEPVSLP